MSARLKELQVELAGVRGRLAEWARRMGVLRERASREEDVQAAVTPGSTEATKATPAPLFHGLGLGGGALDDVELHFEVLDTEDPGREGR
jgi:hypothetical protein